MSDPKKADPKPADPTPAAAAAPLRVRAKETDPTVSRYAGFYKGQRIRSGTVFTLNHPDDFSPRWMEPVDPSTADELAARTNPKKKRPADGRPLVRTGGGDGQPPI